LDEHPIYGGRVGPHALNATVVCGRGTPWGVQIGTLKNPEALAKTVARGGARRAIRSHLRLCRVDGRLGTYLRTRLDYADSAQLIARTCRGQGRACGYGKDLGHAKRSVGNPPGRVIDTIVQCLARVLFCSCGTSLALRSRRT